MGMQKQSRNRSKSQLTKILVGLMVTGSILAIPSKSAAQEVIVKVPPPAVRVETIPPPPNPDYVWDPGHWKWDGHGYVWVPGHYVHKHHHYAKWIPGHWVERHGGWYWVEGHWRH
jgi:hypothetical protein